MKVFNFMKPDINSICSKCDKCSAKLIETFDGYTSIINFPSITKINEKHKDKNKNYFCSVIESESTSAFGYRYNVIQPQIIEMNDNFNVPTQCPFFLEHTLSPKNQEFGQ